MKLFTEPTRSEYPKTALFYRVNWWPHWRIDTGQHSFFKIERGFLDKAVPDNRDKVVTTVSFDGFLAAIRENALHLRLPEHTFQELLDAVLKIVPKGLHKHYREWAEKEEPRRSEVLARILDIHDRNPRLEFRGNPASESIEDFFDHVV